MLMAIILVILTIQKSGYGFSLAPRYRFTNQFSLRYNLNYDKTITIKVMLDEDANNIIFG